MTYKNSAQFITIEDCQKLIRNGVSVIVNDGRDITFYPEGKER